MKKQLIFHQIFICNKTVDGGIDIKNARPTSIAFINKQEADSFCEANNSKSNNIFYFCRVSFVNLFDKASEIKHEGDFQNDM